MDRFCQSENLPSDDDGRICHSAIVRFCHLQVTAGPSICETVYLTESKIWMGFRPITWATIRYDDDVIPDLRQKELEVCRGSGWFKRF
jgi:hypothetical protein